MSNPLSKEQQAQVLRDIADAIEDVVSKMRRGASFTSAADQVIEDRYKRATELEQAADAEDDVCAALPSSPAPSSPVAADYDVKYRPHTFEPRTDPRFCSKCGEHRQWQMHTTAPVERPAGVGGGAEASARGDMRDSVGSTPLTPGKPSDLSIGPSPIAPAVPMGEQEIVVWVDPGEDGVSPDWKALPVAIAIQRTRESAAGHGHIYASDSDALDDFIVVNWATRYTLSAHVAKVERERDEIRADREHSREENRTLNKMIDNVLRENSALQAELAALRGEAQERAKVLRGVADDPNNTETNLRDSMRFSASWLERICALSRPAQETK